MSLLKSQLKVLFKDVYIVKPKSSRASSIEAFVVGLNFQKPDCYKEITLGVFNQESEKRLEEVEKSELDPESKQDL